MIATGRSILEMNNNLNYPGMPQGQPVYQPIDKRIIKQCRHNAEKRWYRRLFVLNLLIIVAAIAYFIYSMDDNREYYENIVDY